MFFFFFFILSVLFIFFFFFFQAEDGIRDLTVTGVQTCALPICLVAAGRCSTMVLGLTSPRPRRSRTLRQRLFRSAERTIPVRDGSRPMNMFSPTDRCGNRLSSW